MFLFLFFVFCFTLIGLPLLPSSLSPVFAVLTQTPHSRPSTRTGLLAHYLMPEDPMKMLLPFPIKVSGGGGGGK